MLGHRLASKEFSHHVIVTAGGPSEIHYHCRYPSCDFVITVPWALRAQWDLILEHMSSHLWATHALSTNDLLEWASAFDDVGGEGAR